MLIDIYNRQLSCHKEFEFYCFKNNCRIVLEYYGIKNAKYFINCSLDFRLLRDTSFKLGYKNVRMTDIQSVIGNCPLVKNSNKVLLHKECKSEALGVWIENKKKIDTGLPLIVFMDLFNLSYNPIFKNKEHGLHSVILAGYTTGSEKPLILDWYQHHWSYKPEMELEEYLEARKSDNPLGVNVASGMPIHNAWVEINREGWDSEDYELLSRTLDLTLDQYYGLSDNNEVLKGIDALKAIYEACTAYLRNTDEKTEVFFRELYISTFMLAKNKSLFKWYMDAASYEFANMGIKDASILLNDISTSWNTLLLLICKCSMAYSYELHKRIADLILECIHLEEKLYDCLCSIKSKII